MEKIKEDSTRVSEKLRKLRRSKGMTVEQLAQKIGENHQKVGRIERGQSQVTLDYVCKVSEALSTSVDELLQASEPSSHSPLSSSNESLLTYVIHEIEQKGKNLFEGEKSAEKASFVSAVFYEAQRFPSGLQKQFVDSVIKITTSCYA